MFHRPHMQPGCTRYGAQMGRHTGPMPSAQAVKWTLQRVRVDAEGYDPGGAYWGLGQPLYWACNEDGESTYFRASSREAAKAHVRTLDPDAKFYR